MKMIILLVLALLWSHAAQVFGAEVPFLTKKIVFDSQQAGSEIATNAIVGFDWAVSLNTSPQVLKVELAVTRLDSEPEIIEGAVYCDTAVFSASSFPRSAWEWSSRGSYLLALGDTVVVTIGPAQTVKVEVPIQFIGDPILGLGNYVVALFPGTFEDTNVIVSLVGKFGIAESPRGYVATSATSTANFQPNLRMVSYDVGTTNNRPSLEISLSKEFPDNSARVIASWPKSFPGWFPEITLEIPPDWNEQEFWEDDYRMVQSDPETVTRMLSEVIDSENLEAYFRLKFNGWTPIPAAENTNDFPLFPF